MALLKFLGQQCESDKIYVFPEQENFLSSVHIRMTYRIYSKELEEITSLKYCSAVFHGQLSSVSRIYNEVWIGNDLKPFSIKYLLKLESCMAFIYCFAFGNSN